MPARRRPGCREPGRGSRSIATCPPCRTSAAEGRCTGGCRERSFPCRCRSRRRTRRGYLAATLRRRRSPACPRCTGPRPPRRGPQRPRRRLRVHRSRPPPRASRPRPSQGCPSTRRDPGCRRLRRSCFRPWRRPPRGPAPGHIRQRARRAMSSTLLPSRESVHPIDRLVHLPCVPGVVAPGSRAEVEALSRVATRCCAPSVPDR
jgi:hypothetical protein